MMNCFMVWLIDKVVKTLPLARIIKSQIKIICSVIATTCHGWQRFPTSNFMKTPTLPCLPSFLNFVYPKPTTILALFVCYVISLDECMK